MEAARAVLEGDVLGTTEGVEEAANPAHVAVDEEVEGMRHRGAVGWEVQQNSVMPGFSGFMAGHVVQQPKYSLVQDCIFFILPSSKY